MMTRSCAIVSTAGGLLTKQEGYLVDANDVVIRTGTAPTSGFQPYVGNRTDYRVMSSAFLQSYRHINVTKLKKQLGRETIVYVNGNCNRADRVLNRRKKGVCFVPAPCTYLHDNYRRQYSTGLFAFLYAFQKVKCTSLVMFGFNTTLNEAYRYHYWTDGSVHDGKSARSWYKSRERSGHEFGAEHQFFAMVTGSDGRIDHATFRAVCSRLPNVFLRRSSASSSKRLATNSPPRHLSASREKRREAVGTVVGRAL